ncbi:MAG: NADH-quinone oxidoreductase subunit C, partial [Victivallaceae bacterium]|nr:NADH-quinone oxidoreductase subunit C [Victivallaceae bacterium]
MNCFLELANGGNARLTDLPRLGGAEFRTGLLDALAAGCRLSSFFAMPEGEGRFLLVAVLLDPQKHCLKLAGSEAAGSYPSLTAENPAFQWFEREIFEEFGLTPQKHPWLKPIRFHGRDGVPRPLPGDTEYFTMHGAAVHEVAVGPVHAGVIEPGHFRFQCMGEDVYSLEIELGYQHRGIEKLLTGGPEARTMHWVETASGDTSCGAAIGFCSILESLGGISVSPRATALRTLALELERIANHVGDLGALAGDVAFLPTASYCGRIRGDFLNRTAVLCGNRFGRGLVVPGGVRYDLDAAAAAELLSGLAVSRAELKNALDLMFDEPSVLDRFENTGVVTAETAKSIGLVGVAARASGLGID